MFRPLCVSFCGAIILSDGRRVPPRYTNGRLYFFIISRKCVKINPLQVFWFVNDHKSTPTNFCKEVNGMARNKKQTSKAVATKANQILKDGRYSGKSKSVAGSALAQTRPGKKK